MEVNKTVLVTGGTGFIGAATVRKLLAAGWNVTIGSNSKAIGGVSPCRVINLDLLAPEKIMALADVEQFDAIVHLGAQVDFCESAAADLFTPNTLSTGAIAYLAKIWGAHLVFASTVAVHGLSAEYIDISTPINIDSPYANTKWLSEQLITASRAPNCILRLGGVFGLRGPGHLGLNNAIYGALNGIVPVQVGDGVALRNYIYVDDVAIAIAHVLTSNISGVHVLAGREDLSLFRMLNAVCDQYLPGQRPRVADGLEAKNQVIRTSSYMPVSRCFQQALIDIQKEFLQ